MSLLSRINTHFSKSTLLLIPFLIFYAISDNQEKERRNDTRTKQESKGRSAAIERAYVHDVYENCEESTAQNRPTLNPSVTKFLAGLEAGSLVCDVGSGDGRYLAAACNPFVYTIGVDRCFRLTKVARGKGAEVSISFHTLFYLVIISENMALTIYELLFCTNLLNV